MVSVLLEVAMPKDKLQILILRVFVEEVETLDQPMSVQINNHGQKVTCFMVLQPLIRNVVAVTSCNSQVDQFKAKLCKFRSLIVEEILVNIILIFKYQEEDLEFLTDVLKQIVSLEMDLPCTQIHLFGIGEKDMEEPNKEMIVINCQMS